MSLKLLLANASVFLVSYPHLQLLCFLSFRYVRKTIERHRLGLNRKVIGLPDLEILLIVLSVKMTLKKNLIKIVICV